MYSQKIPSLTPFLKQSAKNCLLLLTLQLGVIPEYSTQSKSNRVSWPERALTPLRRLTPLHIDGAVKKSCESASYKFPIISHKLFQAFLNTNNYSAPYDISRFSSSL